MPLAKAKALLSGEDPIYPVVKPVPMPGLEPLTNVGNLPKATLPQVPGVTPMPQVNPAVPPPVTPPVVPPTPMPQVNPAVPPPVTPPVVPPTPMPQVNPEVPPPVTPPAPVTPPPVPPPVPMPAVEPLAAPQAPPPNDAGVSDFGPGNDLRYTQFAPQASERLATTGGQVDTARNALATAPDRQALALETLKLAQEQADPAYQQQVRQVGQNAAKWGRIGAGMTTNELGDLATVHNRDQNQLAQSTALQAAGQTLADRQSNLTTLGALETDQFNKEAAQRGELRGERTYQKGTADKALQDAINQRVLEENLTQGAYGRQMGQAQLGLQGADIAAGNAATASNTTNDFLTQLALEEALKNRAGG